MKSAIFAMGMLVASAAAADGGAWSKTARPLVPGAGRTASVSAPSGGALQIFTDQTSFDAAVGDPGALASETFEGGATQAGTVNTCTEPVNSASNDVCFAPGDLIDGFEITSSSGAGVVALGAGLVGPGQTSTVLGANEFPASTIVTFTTPVAAFSADLYEGIAAGEIAIEAFDDGDVSLGTATATPAATDEPVFLGIISDTPIARITMTGAADGGELLDNLRFGDVGGGGDDIIFQDGFEGGSAPAAPTVAKAFAPASIAVDSDSVLTITLANTNATSATLSADLVDTFPLGVVVADPSDAATTCVSGSATAVAGGGSVTLSSGAQIPASGSCTVTVSVTSAEAATYTNTITAGSLQTDLGNSEADATADLTVTEGGGTCEPLQLLQDPGFEATDNSGFPYANPSWDGTSTNFGTPFCDVGCGDGGATAGPHAGAFWTWLGGAPAAEDASVSQDVVIPTGQTRFLNFWLWIGSIGDGSTNLDVAVDGTVITSFPEPAEAEAGYTQRGIDVSTFADGGSHTVSFTYSAPTDTGSNYSLDDVTIDCTPAPLSWPLPSNRPQIGSTLRVTH